MNALALKKQLDEISSDFVDEVFKWTEFFGKYTPPLKGTGESPVMQILANSPQGLNSIRWIVNNFEHWHNASYMFQMVAWSISRSCQKENGDKHFMLAHRLVESDFEQRNDDVISIWIHEQPFWNDIFDTLESLISNTRMLIEDDYTVDFKSMLTDLLAIAYGLSNSPSYLKTFIVNSWWTYTYCDLDSVENNPDIQWWRLIDDVEGMQNPNDSEAVIAIEEKLGIVQCEES